MPVILPTLIILSAAIGGFLLSVLFIRILFRPYSPKKILGFRLHGIVPAILPALARQASLIIQEEYLSKENVAAKLEDPALLQQLQPAIEAHVDHFLAHKLKEAFPLLSNFMGEKTLIKFKAAFLEEVETILPDLLKSYSGTLLAQWNLNQLLENRLNSLKMESLEKNIHQKAARQLKLFYMAGALGGGITGMVQVILIKLINT